MFNRFTFFSALVVTSVCAFAATPHASQAEALRELTIASASATFDGKPVDTGHSSEVEQMDAAVFQSNRGHVSTFSLANAEVVEIDATTLESPALTAVAGVVNSPKLSAPQRAPGTVVEGTMFTADLSAINGSTYGFRITLTKADGDNAYTITNIYGLGSTINATIDAAAGTVTIPCQTVASVSQGDVKICPMTFTSGPTYSTGDIVGTIDANGKITLPGWGLLITEGENAGNGYNFFLSSEIMPSNATVTAFDIVNATNVSYGCLITQADDNSLTFRGLSGVTGETLNSRLTSGKKVQIPNSFVYSNAYYGDFYIFPYDIATEKAQAGSNLIGTYASGVITFPAWAIASRQYPTTYVGYKYSDVKVTPNFDIVWPAAPEFNVDGEGTAESPYVIRTVADYQALAATVADGFDFEGDHFTLGADLDFSSVASVSFRPVGEKGTPFNGVFDGAGHSVKNLTVSNYSFCELALFGRIGPAGVVKNINVEGFRLSSTGSYVAAVVGFSEGTIENAHVTATSLAGNCEMTAGVVGVMLNGSVTNSSFQGALTGNGSVAGIAGQAADAVIKNCAARANITQSGYYSSTCRDAAGIVGAASGTEIANCSSSGMIQDSAGYAATGGLVGRLLSGSSLTSSFTVAAISATGNSTIGGQNPINCYQGGLMGYVYDAKEVRDCYSASYIFQQTTVAAKFAGGLVGYLGVGYSYSTATGSSMNYLTHFYNCYFSGQVYSALAEAHKNIYGTTYHLDSWTGDQPEDIAFHSCYYDSQVALLAGDEFGRPTEFFTNGLPDGYDSGIWTASQGRYPVLTALASEQAAELSSAPVFLQSGQSVTKVSKNFTITPLTNVTWGISTGDGVVQQTGALSISGSNVTIGNEYATTTLVALSADGWGMKLYRLAVVPKWFDGEGTAEDPFQLRTADDFVKLNTAVGTYAQPHTGDYFKVMSDIDFTGSAFQGVAYGKGSNCPFGGTLDGDGKTISNLVVDGVVYDADGKASNADSKMFVGLFAHISQTGVVKNLNIAANCSFKGYAYVGAISGALFGRIENCRNYGSVASANSYAGGIVGYATKGVAVDGYDYAGAVVTKCYNAGDVCGSFTNYGGIVGYSNAEVSLCQNDGSVYAKSMSSDTDNTQVNIVGGVVGQNAGSVDRCVNNATVTGYYAVGGIAGSNNNGSITNSLNNGFVNALTDDVRRGGVIGSFSSKNEIANNYYDSSINVNGASNNAGIGGVNGLSSNTMTSGILPDGLPADDFDVAEGKYPVLKAYADEPASAALRSMVAFFSNGENRSNALNPVALSAGTEWSLTVKTAFSIVDNTLKVDFPADLSVPTDTLVAVKTGFTKRLPISAIPVILSGDGTETSPYLIETPEEWNKLSDFMYVNKYEYAGKYFRVVNDLDFKGDSIRLLAVNGVKFEGVFDGNGRTVKNYRYGNSNSTSVASKWVGPNLYRGATIGLFGTIGADGVVKNLTANGSFTAVTNIGGIAGEVYGTLENCVHSGTIANTSGSYCAGVANKVYDGGRLINCVNNGSVTSKTTYASGIVSTVMAGGLLDGCVNNGNVKSTTTGANGIAYTVGGTVRNSANHGKLSGTGIASGICNTLQKTGKLENCYNDADILYGETGGTVMGVVYNTTDQTTKGTLEPTSWIKGCYNTGNLSGKATVCGFSYTIKKGVLVEDCYNTGDVEAVTTNGSYGFTGAITSNNAADLVPTQIRRCWNGGNVTSNTVASTVAVGFGKTVAAGTIIEDCYNLGDVTVKGQPTSNSQICCAVGFIGQISGGTISRCWNAGTVYGLTPCSGGLAGYVSGSNVTTIRDCFNLGDVTGSSLLANGNAGNTNGTAGGLFGYISTGNPHIINCYNAGTVTGNNRVGGLAGGMFRPDAVVENCYNSGKVVCGNSWWSGTIYTAKEDFTSGGVSTPYFANSKNLYYDTDITTGTEYRNFPGSAKTTAEMSKLDLGEGFRCYNTYPVLASFAENYGDHEVDSEASKVSTAMALVNEGDTYASITGIVALSSAADVKWTAEGDGELEIINFMAYPRKSGKVVLTASNADRTMSRSFDLDIKNIVTGIDDLEADGKTIISTLYVDMAGRIIPAPAAGQPYVVKVTYDDGTTAVRKVAAAN